MNPENTAGDNTPEKQPPINSGETPETSNQVPQSFSELGIQPGSLADTAKEQIEFLTSLSDEERSKAEKKLGRPLDEGGAFRVRITAKDGTRPPREGLFEFSHFQKFLGKKEKNELTIRNPEQSTAQKTEIATTEPKVEGKQSKTDWSYMDELMRNQKEEERSKMTSEEVADDDKKREQVEETQKWFERQKKIKEGDPKAIAEDEEERKKTHNYVARKRQEMGEENNKSIQKLKMKAYENSKKEMERFRIEHGIKKSEKELQQQDMDLRNKFGIE